jgi:hypothetical protein
MRRVGVVLAAAGVAGVLMTGGYLAGVALSHGSTASTSAENAAGRTDDTITGAGRRAAHQDGSGGSARVDAASGRVTAGVITAKDGDRLVLASRDGASVTVHTSASTTVRGSSLADLAVGDLVIVAGTRADDGSITATEILGGPPGVGAPGRNGGQGGGQGGGQTAQADRVTT